VLEKELRESVFRTHLDHLVCFRSADVPYCSRPHSASTLVELPERAWSQAFCGASRNAKDREGRRSPLASCGYFRANQSSCSTRSRRPKVSERTAKRSATSSAGATSKRFTVLPKRRPTPIERVLKRDCCHRPRSPNAFRNRFSQLNLKETAPYGDRHGMGPVVGMQLLDDILDVEIDCRLRNPNRSAICLLRLPS
jgi:hypothetical protein